MNKERIRFNLKDYLTLNIAVSADEGDKIHGLLKDFLLKLQEGGTNEIIAINFSEIEIVNTAFLNAAIGQLYADFNSEFLNKHLTIEDINPNDLVYLEKTLETAIEFYKNPKTFGDDVSEIMKD